MNDKHYIVTWTIDVYANEPRFAAETALKIQRDIDSIATIFEVREAYQNKVVSIDLSSEQPTA